MKGIFSGLVILSLLSACNKVNQAGVISLNMLNGSDSSFLQNATMTNLSEIATAKLADSVALRSEVKSFAKLVIANRRSEQQSLDSIALKWNIILPVVPEGQQLAVIAFLRQTGPALFDAAYTAGQQTEQEAAGLFYQQEIKLGSNPQVVSYAKRILPVLEADLAAVDSLVAP